MKDKKAVSLMISYVILIAITIVLALLVYGWLRFYLSPGEERQSCPTGTKLVIKNYDYNPDAKTLDITIQNRGRFEVLGFMLKVHDRPGAKSGFYILEPEGEDLLPGEEFSQSYDLTDLESEGLMNELTILEIQPFVLEGEEKVLCADLSSIRPGEYIEGEIPSESCFDSDGGGLLDDQYKTLGIIRFGGYTPAWDYCTGNILTEYQCDSSNSKKYNSSDYDCIGLGEDYVCQDGKCTDIPGEPEPDLIHYYDFQDYSLGLVDRINPPASLFDSGVISYRQLILNTVVGPNYGFGFSPIIYPFKHFLSKFGSDFLGLNSVNSRTISVWINPLEIQGKNNGIILSSGDFKLYLQSNNDPAKNRIILTLNNGITNVVSNEGAWVSDDNWHHLVVSIDKSDTENNKVSIEMFYDNTQLTLSSSTIDFNLNIYNLNDIETSVAYGDINFVVSQFSPTPSQTPTSGVPSPIVNYNFNGVYHDLISAGAKTPVFSQTGCGNAYLDNSQEFTVLYKDNAQSTKVVDGDDFSVSFWTKLPEYDGGVQTYWEDIISQTGNWEFTSKHEGSIQFCVREPVNTYCNPDGMSDDGFFGWVCTYAMVDNPLDTNKWIYVTGTYDDLGDNGVVSIYIDSNFQGYNDNVWPKVMSIADELPDKVGKFENLVFLAQQGFVIDTALPLLQKCQFPPETDFYQACYSPGSKGLCDYNGAIDEFKFYKTALTEYQIQNLYNQEKGLFYCDGCVSGSDCGTNGYIGERFCGVDGTEVYQNYMTYTCSSGNCGSFISKRKITDCLYGCADGICLDEQKINCTSDLECKDSTNYYCSGKDVMIDEDNSVCRNPGTPESFCTIDTSSPRIVKTCPYRCSGGCCIECDYNSNCGTDSSLLYCNTENTSVLKTTFLHTCYFPQTCDSKCLDSSITTITQTCTDGCKDGECIPGVIECSKNTDCGVSRYIGNKLCYANEGRITQRYITYICNNPGTTSSSCSEDIDVKTIKQCYYSCGDIGGEIICSEDIGYQYFGKMDELRIFNQPYSSSKVSTLYNLFKDLFFVESV